MNEDELLATYEHILHFIEDAVLSFYDEHADLSDHDVDKVYETINRTLQSELRGKTPPKIKLKPIQSELHEGLIKASRWLLGEGKLEDEEGVDVEVDEIPKDDLAACYKRLRKSIKLWTADYGRQGYLDFLKRNLHP